MVLLQLKPDRFSEAVRFVPLPPQLMDAPASMPRQRGENAQSLLVWVSLLPDVK